MTATHVAFDDTDSPDGMCTTYLATLMIDALSEWDLIGPPRLVRLNPNVPWKTRGNAAVCLSFGKGAGGRRLCGFVGGREIFMYERGAAGDPRDLIEKASEVIEANAEFSCGNTHPGLVCGGKRPSPALYWRAVRGVVPLSDVETQLEASGALWKRFKNGRGVIGASAAMSWRPHDRSWEVITYRSADRIGTRRDIDPSSVVKMDQTTRYTFNNYDYESGHVAIAPASPCPVLYGIRGDSPEELLLARDMIHGEPPASWLLYMTNQGTDDHIVPRRIRTLGAHLSAELTVEVSDEPRTIEGGHVVVGVTDGQEIEAMFYEPSGSLRRAARALMIGDRAVLFGSYRESPRGFNVEKMRVVAAPAVARKVRNPCCPSCGKRMGSMGHGQGYRCKICGRRAAAADAEHCEEKRVVKEGWHEPPVSSRRHLYKPVRRMSNGT